TPVKFASPIIASTDEVGTPLVQLLELLHAVLEVPFQLVCALACWPNPEAMTPRTSPQKESLRTVFRGSGTSGDILISRRKKVAQDRSRSAKGAITNCIDGQSPFAEWRKLLKISAIDSI